MVKKELLERKLSSTEVERLRSLAIETAVQVQYSDEAETDEGETIREVREQLLSTPELGLTSEIVDTIILSEAYADPVDLSRLLDCPNNIKEGRIGYQKLRREYLKSRKKKAEEIRSVLNRCGKILPYGKDALEGSIIVNGIEYEFIHGKVQHQRSRKLLPVNSVVFRSIDSQDLLCFFIRETRKKEMNLSLPGKVISGFEGFWDHSSKYTLYGKLHDYGFNVPKFVPYIEELLGRMVDGDDYCRQVITAIQGLPRAIVEMSKEKVRQQGVYARSLEEKMSRIDGV